MLATMVGVVFWGLVYNFTTTYNICWTKVCICVTLHKQPTEAIAYMAPNILLPGGLVGALLQN